MMSLKELKFLLEDVAMYNVATRPRLKACNAKAHITCSLGHGFILSSFPYLVPGPRVFLSASISSLVVVTNSAFNPKETTF